MTALVVVRDSIDVRLFNLPCCEVQEATAQAFLIELAGKGYLGERPPPQRPSIDVLGARTYG